MEKRTKLNKNELAEWLRLARAESIGPVTFKHLISKFKTAREALKQLPSLCAKVGRTKELKILSQEKALEYIYKCEQSSVELIASCESDYPDELRQISDPPAIIHIKGKKDLLLKKGLAIVGSRNASLQGIAFAQKIAKEVNEEGIVIISGLARGIDAAAHSASLQNGTIAVLACGVDIVYPLENKALYEKISQNGLLISEVQLGKEPRPQVFTYRNRIISGIASLGVLVVEAAFKSGSLITARYATEQGKDVFAVPGHPYDPRAHGTNYLIKQGAYLIEKAEDLIRHERTFGIKNINLFDDIELNERFESNAEIIYEEVKEYLKNKLSASPISINEIIRQGIFTSYEIQGAIAELELAGEIEIEAQNLVKKFIKI